ncbi:MAG: recombination protein O N-terminal domain-containing protein, partial [Simkaniaceae bacterium]|nr:recombination protein O N-terminal domain-containing protein [Simkaniaceae bacterium]
MNIIEGIITKAQNYGDKDRLVTLFTSENGIMRGIVKGVGRKKMAATTPGTCVEYTIRKTKSGL